jgi:hypothetical protein
MCNPYQSLLFNIRYCLDLYSSLTSWLVLYSPYSFLYHRSISFLIFTSPLHPVFFISISTTAQLHYQTRQLVPPTSYTSEFWQFYSRLQTYVYVLYYKTIYYLQQPLIYFIAYNIFEFIKVPKYPLQTGRSRVRFPMMPMVFFTDVILPVALWPWGRLSH